MTGSARHRLWHLPTSALNIRRRCGCRPHSSIVFTAEMIAMLFGADSGEPEEPCIRRGACGRHRHLANIINWSKTAAMQLIFFPLGKNHRSKKRAGIIRLWQNCGEIKVVHEMRCRLPLPERTFVFLQRTLSLLSCETSLGLCLKSVLVRKI